MSDPRPTNLYPCSQADLYAVCRIGWNSYLENQPDFQAFSTIYTALFGTNALADVESAVNLPGEQEREEADQTFRIQLVQAHSVAILRWKSLRTYIKHAFPEELQQPKIESAGYDHFAKAANLNWAETNLLMVAGQHFIDNNTAELTTGGMPATFATEYTDATNDFLGYYDKFTDAEQDSQEATDKKMNAIYKALIAMFLDAQLIYEHDASKRERFIFSQIYAMITRPGGSGNVAANVVAIYGKVTSANTGQDIALASVNTTPDGTTQIFSAVTDESGNYELKVTDLTPNTSGTLIVNALALDFDPTSLPLNYQTGNKYELNILLQQFTPPQPTP